MHDLVAQLTNQDYSRAERFLRLGEERLVLNTLIIPNWIENSDRFWYRRETHEGHEFVFFDPASNSTSPSPEQARPTHALVESNELVSPDGNTTAFVANYNIHIRNLETDRVKQITTDGILHFDYGSSPESNCTTVTDAVAHRRRPPVAIWSPDSKKILVHKLDQRKVKELFLVQSVSDNGGYIRPILHSYKYPLVGDEELATVRFVIINLEKQTVNEIAGELVAYLTPIEMQYAWWGDDSTKVFHLSRERGEKVLSLHEIDAATGKTRLLIEERGMTPVEPNILTESVFKFNAKPNVKVLSTTGEIIWFSQREGWGHLYLYDNDGSLKYKLTKGDYVVRELLFVDEQGRWMYFTAGGREKGRDPYFRHLYRISMDGNSSTTELLTPEDADHYVRFSPSGKYFVDTFSTVDSPPITVVRKSDGEQVRILEAANIDRLVGLGWKPPERFSTKAADGVTDIYGVIYRPSNFTPDHPYPVVDDIYPGPSFIRSAKSFDPDPDSRIWFWHPQALAELGFVVVTIDGTGSAFRSKKFQDVAYGKYERSAGIVDHIAALRHLKGRYPYLDLDRVGIYGHSGGGYASVRAMLEHPEFYKVCVSSSGNHDQRGYVAAFGEKYQGLPKESDYASQANESLASNLRGKLLLVHGDMDDNVHPSLTIRLVKSLISANKDFDLLILPGCNHNLWTNPYFIRRRWDYFVRHLLGSEPPEDYRLRELPSEDPFIEKSRS